MAYTILSDPGEQDFIFLSILGMNLKITSINFNVREEKNFVIYLTPLKFLSLRYISVIHKFYVTLFMICDVMVENIFFLPPTKISHLVMISMMLLLLTCGINFKSTLHIFVECHWKAYHSKREYDDDTQILKIENFSFFIVQHEAVTGYCKAAKLYCPPGKSKNKFKLKINKSFNSISAPIGPPGEFFNF